MDCTIELPACDVVVIGNATSEDGLEVCILNFVGTGLTLMIPAVVADDLFLNLYEWKKGRP